MEWSPSDVHIRKFEMKRWLETCDFDLAASGTVCSLAPTSKKNALHRTTVAKLDKIENAKFFLGNNPHLHLYLSFEYVSVLFLALCSFYSTLSPCIDVYAVVRGMKG